MDTLAIEEISAEIIPRDMSSITLDDVPTKAIRPILPLALFDRESDANAADGAEAAISIVNDAARAIRDLEEMSKRAIENSRNAAMEAKERLEKAEDYAAKAETALQQAELEIKELTKSVSLAQEEIQRLNAVVATKDDEIEAMAQRASAAEERAEEANATVVQIVAAIRTQLPVASELPEMKEVEIDCV